MLNKIFSTSESVSEGHPDKIADQISDSILDAILSKDKNARVACESLVKSGMVLVAGEIDTFAWVDIEDIIRKVIIDIGYDKDELGFNGSSCAVINLIGKQSIEIAKGINKNIKEKQGAGDQGIIFGFACNETSSFMPATIYYAHKLVQLHAKLRKNNIIPWLRPDAKSQVTLRYVNNKPIEVDTIVFSTQHEPDMNIDIIRKCVIEKIIKPTIPNHWLSNNTKFFINPTGSFISGGPVSDCGLTGRKIIVDTYGGIAHHGGGAFSGKDPSKVDRSAAYMSRYIAKNIVASGLADKCELQISYAIGIAQPISIDINTFNTEKIDKSKIKKFIIENFDFRPYAIIKKLDLLKPIYQKTSNYGHFGREDHLFSWEKTDLIDIFSAIS